MKKILLVMAALFCVATVSAQKSVVETVKDSKWSVGLRVGNGLQAQAEMFINNKNYIEARFGMAVVLDGFNRVTADFTALYNWNCFNWNWTPKVATWYLDAGCGFNIGGGDKAEADVYDDKGDTYAFWVSGTNVYAGLAGQVKFGMKFKKVPIRLSVDYTPVLGFYNVYPTANGKELIKDTNAAGGITVKAKHNGDFYRAGLYNIAVSATWCF